MLPKFKVSNETRRMSVDIVLLPIAQRMKFFHYRYIHYLSVEFGFTLIMILITC